MSNPFEEISQKLDAINQRLATIEGKRTTPPKKLLSKTIAKLSKSVDQPDIQEPKKD